MALYANGINKRTSEESLYFDGFGDKHIPAEITKFN